MHNNTTHIPVMLNEVLQSLHPQQGEVIVDGTFGAGGYSRAILQSANCTVYAIDRDPDAIIRAKQLQRQYPDRFYMLHGCFGNMRAILSAVGVHKVAGIVLDVGVSSPQLDESNRGFSFTHEGPLDMRMSQSGTSAYDIVNTYTHGALARIIKYYGEEKMAARVAAAIVTKRTQQPITTTRQLADIVRGVVHSKHRKNSKNSKIDPATRTFQAIRIAVNDELNELQRALQASIDLLSAEGRLTVVSFHSLEDRIVKRFLKDNDGRRGGNRHMPMADIPPAVFKVQNHKAIVCTRAEAAMNPRSRSAKLRTAIRTNNETSSV